MREQISTILLWIFVINLGIAFGAGLYESRIAFPQWLVYSAENPISWNAEAARQADSGLRFWVYVTSVSLTLVTVASLIAALLSPSGSLIRSWWLAASLVSLVERVFTFSYFIPTMVRLTNINSLTQSEAVSSAVQWGYLNNLRHAFALVAWLLALKAFSLLGR